MDNRLKLKLSETLNRSIVYTAFPKDSPLSFAVMFNKRSSGLETQYDTKNPLVTNRQVKVRLHRDLRSCMFCNTFFNLESVEDGRRDYRSKLIGVNPIFKNTVFQFSSELIDLRTPKDDDDDLKNGKLSKGLNNYINVIGWKVFDYETDLIYYFVERKIFNVITRSQVIRTMGIQMTTDRGYRALCQYYDHYNNINTEEKDDTPSYLKNDTIMDEILDSV